jgi:hypothetical protein
MCFGRSIERMLDTVEGRLVMSCVRVREYQGGVFCLIYRVPWHRPASRRNVRWEEH